MSIEEKRKAKEVEERKRRAVEEKRREVEKMAEAELEAFTGNGMEYQKDQCLAKTRLMGRKIIAREEKEQKRREMEDNFLRLEREETRMLRIAELAMAKV